jgi:hypothetical protein
MPHRRPLWNLLWEFTLFQMPALLLDGTGTNPYNLNGIKTDMSGWRNRQTRTFEGRVVNTVGVQVPLPTPIRCTKSGK